MEQGDDEHLNRGKLRNIGFVEAMKVFPFNCVVFHDFDLVPENDQILYECDSSPAHLSVAVSSLNYKLPYNTIFGGVEMFKSEDFRKINGFPNSFWAWGSEDDNLYQRLKPNGFFLHRPPAKFARYKMIVHQKDHEATLFNFTVRMAFFKKSLAFLKEDGLNSQTYSLIWFRKRPLCTHILANVERAKSG